MVRVLTDGVQRPDGSEERFITVIDEGIERLCELTSDQAREIAAPLIAAADEVDGVASRDQAAMDR